MTHIIQYHSKARYTRLIDLYLRRTVHIFQINPLHKSMNPKFIIGTDRRVDCHFFSASIFICWSSRMQFRASSVHLESIPVDTYYSICIFSCRSKRKMAFVHGRMRHGPFFPLCFTLPLGQILWIIDTFCHLFSMRALYVAYYL